MSIEWMLYLASIADKFKLIINIILLISLISGIIFLIFYYVNYKTDEDINKTIYLKWLKKNLIIFMLTSILTTFIPGERTLYMIMGVSLIKKIPNNYVYNKSILVVNKKLDEYLKENKK